MATALRERGDDGRRGGETVALEHSLDRGDAHVGEVDRPRQDRGRADRVEHGERRAKRRNLAPLEVGLLNDHAFAGGERGPDSWGVRAEHDQAWLYVQRLQGL